MKLNVYKNQSAVEKTYEIETYDIFYGTVEDILGILDDSENMTAEDLADRVSQNRDKLNRMILEVFPEMTAEELRRVKVKELIRFFAELFVYVGRSFSNPKN